MAVNSVNTVAHAETRAAQQPKPAAQVQGPAQKPANKPVAQSAGPADKPEPAKPVVNTKGQTTGRVINVSA